MTLTSTNDYASIFKDGKLKPGVYKIQNIVSQTYVDIREHTRELCCRPAAVLEGNGLWEILPLGPGYTIHKYEPWKPEQFCTVFDGLRDGQGHVSVAPFPVAWRMEMVHDERYRGCEYVRFFWGTTDMIWDLADYGSEKDRTPVHYKANQDFEPCRIWKLIPVNLDAGSRSPIPEATSVPTPGSGPLPPCDGNQGNQRCNCSRQATETNDDEVGTTVTEVTVTTTTTRKKYRVYGE